MKTLFCNPRNFLALAGLLAGIDLVAFTSLAAQVKDAGDQIQIVTPNYRLDIVKQNFRYGFTRPDGTVIAAPNDEFGLEFGGGHSVGTTLRSSAPEQVVLERHQ